MRPITHPGSQGALCLCRGDVQYSPAEPRAEPGPPGRRPGGPGRGTSRTWRRTSRGLQTTPTCRAHCRHAGQTCSTDLLGRGPTRTPRPQARRPRSRYQPHVVTDETRPTNHLCLKCGVDVMQTMCCRPATVLGGLRSEPPPVSLQSVLLAMEHLLESTDVDFVLSCVYEPRCTRTRGKSACASLSRWAPSRRGHLQRKVCARPMPEQTTRHCFILV